MAKPSRLPMRFVSAGVLCIFGGESFCLFGPHVDAVHVSCHVVLYAGMIFFVLGTVLHLASSR